MNKTELVAKIAEGAGMSKVDAKKALDATLEAIVKAVKKSDCRLLPLNPGVSAGQTVQAEFTGRLRPDFKVKKVDAAKGRIWVEDKYNKETVKSFLEVVK